MSTAAGDASVNSEHPETNASSTSPLSKGKEKAPKQDVSMEDEEEEEEEEEDGDDKEEEEESEAEEDFSEIDPSAIIGSRRTRGKKVDYTSPEALAKAGLKPEGEDDEDDEEMKDA